MAAKRILVVDVGGSHVKALVTGAQDPRRFVSGPKLSAKKMVAGVLGGGNAHELKELPPGVRLGANENAFLGGFRLWQSAATRSRGGGSRSKARSSRRP
jgi:hypothetical protein